jgi:putative phosphoesterase
MQDATSGPIVRVGLISDTHGKLRNEVFTRFHGVDHILHAGDIEDADILVALATIAPVDAVFGNTDGFHLRRRLTEKVERKLAGRRMVLIHGHQFGSPHPADLAAAFPDADIVVFGHTHRPLAERIGSALFINPGAAGPARFGLKPSVAILELSTDSATVSHLEL